MDTKRIPSRITLGIVACLSILLFTSAIGKFEAYYHTNPEVADGLHPGFEMLDSDPPQITWTQTGEGFPGNPFIRKELSTSYVSAWKWLFASLNNNDLRGLDDYFHKEIKEKLIRSLNSQNLKVASVDLEHNLELVHLSDDYTVAVLKDKNVRILTYMTTENGSDVVSENWYDFEVNMILRDGKWKVFNWSSKAAEEIIATENKINDKLSENLEKVKDIKGINYYPSSTPWTEFWKGYDSDVISKDLTLIREMGFNTVRIFLPIEDFGRNKIETSNVEKLDDLLCLMAQHDLSVIPTLFDFPIGFDLNTYPSYLRQLKYLVSRYNDNNSIIAWDIKNEADQDFNIHGQRKVLSWLSTMLKEYKRYNNNHPVTIGWANADNSSLLYADVDFISFHHYKSIEDLRKDYATIKELGKPILLEEFGYSSTRSIWNLYQGSEKKQEEYLDGVLDFIESNEIPWMAWTLHDFDSAPSEVFGSKPWIKDSQKKFGLVKSDGTLKSTGKNIVKFNKNI